MLSQGQLEDLGRALGQDPYAFAEQNRSNQYSGQEGQRAWFEQIKGYAPGPGQLGIPTVEEQRMKAIQPAIASYEASKPEIAERYQVRESQLQSEKQPLLDRYSNLIADLTGREAKTSAQQGQVTSTEYGKRGIPLSSGMYAQDLANKLAGITYDYGVQRKDVGLSQEADLRNLENMISNLASDRIQTMREIDNAIGGLKAGAGNQAVSDALDLYKQQKEYDFQSRFDDLNKQLMERQLAPTYDLKEFDGGLYQYNPLQPNSLQLLQKSIGSGTKLSAADKSLTQYQSDVSSGRFSLGDLIFKYQDTLSVDQILSQYTANSPYGPYRESTDQLKQMFGFE